MNRRRFIWDASKMLMVPFVAPLVTRAVSPLIILAGSPRNGLLNNLVGYYKLDESSGDAVDSSVNSRLLTNTNGPTAGTGLLNGCRILNGTTNNRSFFSSDAAFQFTTAFTLSIWIKSAANDTNVRGILGKTDVAAASRGWLLRKNASKQIETILSADGTATTACTYTAITLTSTTAWYHLFARFSGTTATISMTDSATGTVNADVTASFTGPLHGATVDMVMGGFFTAGVKGSYWTGSLDECAIYNIALNDTQKAQLYNGGTPLAFSNFTN